MTTLVDRMRYLRHTLVPLPRKYGPEFRRLFDFLQEHQYAGREELAAFQWQQLKALLEYAYVHVPYYRRTFGGIGLHPNDIKTPEDFRQVPILSKEDVAAHSEELKSDQFDQLKPISTTTSATTRDGLVTYRSGHLESYRKAVVWRHFFNIGYHFRDRRAQLTVPLNFVATPTEMPIDHNENSLLIDPRGITDENIRRIYERLASFQPKLLFCQPSNAAMLVESFRRNNLSPLMIPIVYCLGERLYPEYRAAITSFFGDNLIQYYGNRENTASAGELADGRMYINSEYCYLEFLSPDNRPLVGSPADIISTSLQNFAFPLIRYQTEDLGVYHGYPEPVLRSFETMEVIGGRGKDLLLTKTGLIAPQVIPIIDSVCANRYRRIQLEQPTRDELIVRLIPNAAFNHKRDPALVRKAVSDGFDGQFRVSVELVDDIKSTGASKYKFVISEPAMKCLRVSNSAFIPAAGGTNRNSDSH